MSTMPPSQNATPEKPALSEPVAPVNAKTSLTSRYKKPAMIVIGCVVAVVVVIFTYDSFTHETTDDAYVTGHLHNVSPRINEVVTEVLVNDNQFVHEGDVLVKLDTLQNTAVTMGAQAQVAKAEADLHREEPLVAIHAVSPQDIDALRSTWGIDLAELKVAQLQLEYTTIRAPATGYVGRKNVEVGNRVSSGQTLLVVVEPETWVVANFKETQLAKMRVGQPVRVTVDSIPDKIFSGRIDSFSPASGNQFALLPADNSTGNFTKIVQRVPVKIVFDPDSIRGYETRIRAGESAVVKVAITAEPTPTATAAK